MLMSSGSSGGDPMFGTMTTKLLQQSGTSAAGGLGSPASSALGKATGGGGGIALSSVVNLDGALGAAASVGASLFLLRVTLYGFGTLRPSVTSWVRRLLRNLLLEDAPPPAADAGAATVADQEEDGDGSTTIVSHQGSCHCGSIQFEVLAPRTLLASNGPGKIQYQHAYVRTTNFRVYAGHECMRTYYVYCVQHTHNHHPHTIDGGGGTRKAAHGFCERCGVHVLYAPSRNSPMLGINVNCLQMGVGGGDGGAIGKNATRVKLSDRVDGIADGYPSDGQWDTSDQLSTISEVTQPFHFQMNHSVERAGRWKHYTRGGSSGVDSYEDGVEGTPEEGPPPITQFYAATTTTTTGSVVSGVRKFRSNSIGSGYPPNPVTPTTTMTSISPSMDADSYSDQIAQLKVLAVRGSGGATVGDDLTNDDISFSDEASMSSGRMLPPPRSGSGGGRYHRRGGGGNSSITGRPPLGSPRLGGSGGGGGGANASVVPTSSPEVRNQMRYFMGKYKHPSSSNNPAAEHGSQQSITTASTAASSLTSSGLR
jgi:hypothetical protein